MKEIGQIIVSCITSVEKKSLFTIELRIKEDVNYTFNTHFQDFHHSIPKRQNFFHPDVQTLDS